MKNFIHKILLKTAITADGFATKLAPQEAQSQKELQEIRCRPWFQEEGDKTHRLNYELSDASFVIDLGGYEGQWASDIFSKYVPEIFIFEPYLPFADNITKRFSKNKKITVFPFGLGARNEKLDFSVSDNASSIFDKSDHKDQVQIISVKDFFTEHNITKVDLIKINIEGGEYEFLESIIEENLVKNFVNIQVQFHDFFPEAKERMNQIQRLLSETHELTYQFEFVWENWKLK